MRVLEFFDDHGIFYKTGNHKHTQIGWVNIPCPFCTGNAGYHLGYSIAANFFSCWRCGGKSVVDVVKKLCNCGYAGAKDIISQYGGSTYIREQEVQYSSVTSLPIEAKPLRMSHWTYLEHRGFDPEKIEYEWGLLGTGNSGDYRNRIIAPIYHCHRLASYQGRDITGKSQLRYKACKKENESIHHKNILYGIDEVPGKNVVVVEGCPSVWRLGYGAVATFGIKFKQQQVALLKDFKRRYILFDTEAQAMEQAGRLFYILSGFPGETVMLDLGLGVSADGKELDPADMSQDDADSLMRDLVGERL